jgi:hypothetical protein
VAAPMPLSLEEPVTIAVLPARYFSELIVTLSGFCELIGIVEYCRGDEVVGLNCDDEKVSCPGNRPLLIIVNKLLFRPTLQRYDPIPSSTIKHSNPTL